MKNLKTKRILFYRETPGIGDVIMMVRAIELTRLKHPNTEIIVQTRYNELLKYHPAIDYYADLNTIIENVDVRIDNSFYCAEYEAKRTPVLSVSRSQLFCENTAKVLIEHNLEPIEYDGKPQSLYVSRELNDWAQIIISNTVPDNKIPIGIFGKSKEQWKTYPHIRDLVRLLLADKRFTLFYFDDKEQLPIWNVSQFIGYTLDKVAVLVSQMGLIISADSAGLHLAGSFNIPMIGIFGPTNPLLLIANYFQAFWIPVKCLHHPCNYNICKRLFCLRQLKPRNIYKLLYKKTVTIKDKGSKNISSKSASEITSVNTIKIKEKLLSTVPQTIEPVGASYQQIELSQAGTSPIILTSKYQNAIALLRLDGIGGTITLSDQAKKISKYGYPIVLITRGYEALFKNNPYVSKVINVGITNWGECLEKMTPQFIALADIRFAPAKWYQQKKIFEQDFSKWQSMYDDFGHWYHGYNDLALSSELHHIQITDQTLGLHYDTIESEIFGEFDRIIDYEYICINCGVDVIHKGQQQTKCWNGWREVVKLFSDMRVVQVGTKVDNYIVGTIDYRGKTNLSQLFSILRYAKAIICTEGGIMHLAYALKHNNTFVLRGPTKGKLFEYPTQKMIDSYVCQQCVFVKPDWYLRCYADCDAACMKTITPERVYNRVYENLVSH